MNFKLKALVAAVAMAASMSASADVALAGTGNSEMVFQVWDTTLGSESSYTLDTGLTLNSFLSQVGTVPTILSTNLNLDATYNSWFSGLSVAAQSGLQWNLAAADKSGANTYITTAPLTFNNFVGSTSYSTALARELGTSFDLYAAGVNALTPGSLVSDNLSIVVTDKTKAGYAGKFAGNWGGKQTLINTAGSVGSSLNLYKITAPSSGPVAAAPWTQLKSGVNNYTATFSNGNLVVSAVPEADTSAMFLAGLGLMGFIARRRSSKVA